MASRLAYDAYVVWLERQALAPRSREAYRAQGGVFGLARHD